MAMGMALLVAAAQAQTLPGAGDLLRDARPLPAPEARPSDALPAQREPGTPARADDGLRFQIDAFRIEGSHALPVAELEHRLEELRGPRRSMATLEEALARITRLYRERGYLLARAYLPQQRLDDGTVEIIVLEGTLGDIGLHNEARLDSDTLRRRLDRIGLGQPLRADVLERELLLLNDLPGISVRSSLGPGDTVGATRLDVVVADSRRAEAELSLDNQGNRYTGQLHANAVAALNNPLGIGDQLQANAITSGRGFNYGQLSYSAPLGMSGLRGALSHAAMAYRLGDDFSALDAHGTAHITSASLNYPLMRSRQTNLGLQLRYDNKRLRDTIGLVNYGGDKRIDSLTASFSAERADRWLAGARSQLVLGATWGRLALDGDNAAADASSHRTQGHFARTNLQLTRLQALDTRWEILGQANLQYAAGNLDTAEKFSLGGPYAVRAYPSGEAPADDALLLNLELRRNLGAQWQALAFTDYARGRLNHSPIAADGDNLRSLSGLGLGLRWNGDAGYRLSAMLAWRTGDAATSDHDRSPRLWLQVARRI